MNSLLFVLILISFLWQYPKEPPYIDIVESKGLDGKRQAHLITTIQEKAFELSSCLMLVALCEVTVDLTHI